AGWGAPLHSHNARKPEIRGDLYLPMTGSSDRRGEVSQHKVCGWMSDSQSQQRPGTVDVLIQTHNEELNLPYTLASIAGWVNRVFVVDSGSTDKTRQIAEKFGATFVEHAWEGYAGQKNWALDNLPWESQWILILDADEAVSAGLREEILNVVSRPVEQVRH